MKYLSVEFLRINFAQNMLFGKSGKHPKLLFRKHKKEGNKKSWFIKHFEDYLKNISERHQKINKKIHYSLYCFIDSILIFHFQERKINYSQLKVWS